MSKSDETNTRTEAVDIWQVFAIVVCLGGLLLSAAVAPTLGGIDVLESDNADRIGDTDDSVRTNSADRSDSQTGLSEPGDETSAGANDGSNQDESADGTAPEIETAETAAGDRSNEPGGTSRSSSANSDSTEAGDDTAGSDESPSGSESPQADDSGTEQPDGSSETSTGQNGGGETTDDSGDSSRSPEESARQQDLETPSGLGGSLSKENQVGGPISESAFREAGRDVALVSDVTQPVYWRLGSYDTYTGGETWSREGSAQQSSPTQDPAAGERLVQTVELRTQLRAVPGAWQITDVETDTDQTFEQRDDGSVTTTEPLEPGTTLTVESHQPSVDPATLRTAGTNYDRETQARYTQLPDATPRRVETHTDELTAGDDSPYESAKTIERWIKEEKTYDLSASHDPSEPMVDQFIFEMDGVYCDYAASAMVVMLRTQDIPARYVTGFAPGATVDGTQVVTQQNAHAWVEVYFPNEGWVRFDPTPPGDRQSAMQSSVDQETLRDSTADFEGTASDSEPDSETDSGTERTDANGESDGNGSTGEDSDSDSDESSSQSADTEPISQPDIQESPGEEQLSDRLNPPYNISLNRTYIPGHDVQVTVQKAGVPIPNATVFVADEPVGETNEAGQVVAKTPFTKQLDIRVVAPDREDRPQESLRPLGRLPAAENVFANRQPSSGRTLQVSSRPEETNITFETESTLRLSPPTMPTPGSEVDVVVTIDDRPVAGAAIAVAGTEITTTDENGTATVELPDELGTTKLRAERGDFVDEQSIEIQEVNLSVGTRIPFPGRPVEVTVTHGDDHIDNATVTVNGDSVAETTNGTATVMLPLAPEAIISVTHSGMTASQTISGLFRNVGIGGGIFLLAAASIARNRDVSPHDVGHAVVIAAQRIRQYTLGIVSVIIRLGKRPVAAAVWLARGVERLARRATAFIRTLPSTVRAVARWALHTGRRHGLAVVMLLNPVRILSWLLGVVQSLRSRGSAALTQISTDATAENQEGANSSTAASDEARQVTLRDLWETFLSVVHPPDLLTKTPGEIRRYAVAQGFPKEPVERIVQAFRESEYGNVSPPPEQLDQVQGAVKTLTDETSTSEPVEEEESA